MKLNFAQIQTLLLEAVTSGADVDMTAPAPVPVEPSRRVALHTTYVSSPSLRVGDKIVTASSRNGTPLKGTLVRTIEIGRGCGNYHVNGNDCYDVCAEIPIYSTREDY